MEIIVDASAYLAVILNEPEKQGIIELTRGAELISPAALPFEIGNALVAMFKRQRLTENQVLRGYDIFEMIPLQLTTTNISNALKIACEHNIYAYDAYYLELARRLDLPLLTLDTRMQQIALALNLKILEVKI